jgi:hypothetical protein
MFLRRIILATMIAKNTNSGAPQLSIDAAISFAVQRAANATLLRFHLKSETASLT